MSLERQRSLRLVLPSAVAVVGCGGVGSWAAYFLALAGVPSLELWDSDVVSESNLNRLPMGPKYLNMGKSVALLDYLGRVAPKCEVTARFKWSAQEQAEEGAPPWFLVSTDTWASRREVWEWTRGAARHYIEASAEGEWGGVTGEPATFVTPEEEMPGYASVPVHVGPCVMAASLACYHVLHAHALGVASWRVGWEKSGIKVQSFKPKPIKVDGRERKGGRDARLD